MRHLIIMRHAKAERGEGKPDYERMLEQRGWDDADVVGSLLAAEGLVADTVLCSASRRTRDTLAALLPHMGGDCTVRLLESLYSADADGLKNAVRRAEGRCILLIGHNPSVHDLALSCAGGNAEEIGMSFPTSTAAVFSMGFALDTLQFERLITP